MKKNLLFIGKHHIIEEKLKNEYNIIFKKNQNEKIDIILSTEENAEEINSYSGGDIPVIMLVDDDTKLDRIIERNYDFKIHDFILRSYDDISVVEKIENVIILNQLKLERDKIKQEEEMLVSKLRELSQKNKNLYMKEQNLNEDIELESISNVYNKKYILKQYEKELERIKRNKSNFGAAFIKIKNFDYLNKKYGNILGKEAIITRVSRIISDALRKSDILGKIGEDTFFILFTEIIENYSLKVLERMISKVEMIKIKSNNLELTAGYFDINNENANQFEDTIEFIRLGHIMLKYAENNEIKILKYSKDTHDIKNMYEKINFAKQEEKNNMIIEELSKSQKFIEKLLPKKSKWESKINFSYLYYPFNYIGGDFFDFIEIDEDRIAVLFCDVSGHGVSSALYITAIKYIFKNIIKEEKIFLPSEFMKHFNQSIIEISEGNVFVAASYGIFDKKNDKFIYSFGGGTSPILLSTQKNDIELLEKDGGFAIGILEEAEFNYKEIQLYPNDIIFFYSDGIYEFLIEKNIIKDENDFYSIVRDCIEFDEKKFLENIYNHVKSRITGEVDFDDDITLLTIRKNGI